VGAPPFFRTGILTGAQLTLSRHYRVDIWHSGVLGVHESLWVRDRRTAFGEAGVPTFGLEGGVGCNPRVTFDGLKVRNLGPCALKFDSLLPEDHRAHPLDSRQYPPPL
jgi:hypothetical protein